MSNAPWVRIDKVGEHAGEITFDIALESAGALAFATI